MSGELQPSMGDIRPHGHLKIGRFTQHFVDVLNLEQTPLEFFDTMYPGTPREEQRKYLGRFVSTNGCIRILVLFLSKFGSSFMLYGMFVPSFRACRDRCKFKKWVNYPMAKTLVLSLPS